MFQKAMHVTLGDTPGAEDFSGPNRQLLPSNYNTDREAIISIRLNSANIVFIFFALNSMA